MMAPRLEEDPDEEPEEPTRPAQPDGSTRAAGLVPSVGVPSRDYEYSTKALTVAQVADGVTLIKVLHEAGAEGWDLADVIEAGEKRVVLMRRPKRPARESRRVGFAPPTQP